MWELDHKEGLALKNWYFWTMALEKTLGNPLDCKVIKPVNPKGNQSWIFIGRMDAEILIVWLLDEKNWITGKDPNAGKDLRQEEKGTREDEIVGWHHWLNEHELGQTGRWWGIGRSWMLQSMGSQRVRHDWVTDLIWSEQKQTVLRGGGKNTQKFRQKRS